MVDLHIHPYHNDMIEAPVTLSKHIYEGDIDKKEKELIFHYACTKRSILQLGISLSMSQNLNMPQENEYMLMIQYP